MLKTIQAYAVNRQKILGPVELRTSQPLSINPANPNNKRVGQGDLKFRNMLRTKARRQFGLDDYDRVTLWGYHITIQSRKKHE